MKILLVAGFAESIIAFRGELIRTMRAQGHTVHVAAPGISAQLDVKEALAGMGVVVHEIPLVRTGTNPLADLRLVWRFVRLMRKHRFDVFLGYTVKPVIYGGLAAWLACVPHRFSLITGLGFAFTEAKRGVVARVVTWLYALAMARTHKVFFQNPDDEQLFRSQGILSAGVPSVVVNGSGVDIAAFAQQPLPGGAPVFLLMARLIGDKGVREYAAAAARIRQCNPEVRFLLAGRIDSNPEAIKQHELDGWIAAGDLEYLGHVADVRPLIAQATVYVLPSYYREGTPRTVLEAMAMGRPVITTNAPGCRETVVDGENGYLVPVRSVDALVQAMQRFVNDPSLAVRMAARSRRMAEEKYDVHKVNAVMLLEMGLVAVQPDMGGDHDA
jgi:glycosyltransferase involved in cell wall biosynthesis